VNQLILAGYRLYIKGEIWGKIGGAKSHKNQKKYLEGSMRGGKGKKGSVIRKKKGFL